MHFVPVQSFGAGRQGKRSPVYPFRGIRCGRAEAQVNFTVYVPKVDEHFVGSLAVIPLQLLGYYVSVAKGLYVDKPRNLAKSVTVE